MMGQTAFEVVVRDAIERLPERFRHALENVAVVVKEEPDPADLEDMDIDANTGLPDRIEIYRGPILRSFDNRSEIMAEIEDTLIHELGHHMGLDDEGMAY